MTNTTDTTTLAEALREAEFFVQMNSEPAYRTGQQLLAKIRAALAAHDAASAPGMAEALRAALPYVKDEAAKYEDDGGNEPLALVERIEVLLAAHDAASGQPASVSVTDEMVEKACKRYAWREDGATFPDAYSEHEVLAERTLMREFLEHVLSTAQPAQPASSYMLPASIMRQFRRAIEDAKNRKGMRVGLPKVEVDAGNFEGLLDRYEAACAAQPESMLDVNDAEIAAWAERHDLNFGSATDARCAFEDARTYKIAAAPQPTKESRDDH